MVPPTSKTLKPAIPSYPTPTSQLLGTRSLARVVGADRELLYLVVRHEQQIPGHRTWACALKGPQVAEDVLEDDLLGGHEDTLFLHGKQLVKLTHSHQLHRILILMRPTRSLHPMLTKERRRLTHTMAYARIEYLDIDVEPVGSAIALVMALNKSPTIPLGPVKTPVDPKPQPFIHNGKLLVSRVVIRAEKTHRSRKRMYLPCGCRAGRII